jgi:hypothetical protein
MFNSLLNVHYMITKEYSVKLIIRLKFSRINAYYMGNKSVINS